MRKLYKETPKKWIKDLPRLDYSGRIVVLQSAQEAEKAIKVLQQSSIVGFDTETRPAFTKGKSYKVSLIQICNEDICFLFRVHLFGIPQALTDFLSSPATKKVGISLKDDFVQIQKRQSFTPEQFIDLQDLATEMGLKDMSLQKLYANFFAQRISKSARLTNWEADVLTESQKRYASLDAYACLQLYKEMSRLLQTNNFTLIPTPNNSSQ